MTRSTGRSTHAVMALVWIWAPWGRAETSPLDTPLPADQVTLVACEWAGDAPETMAEKPKSALKRPSQLKPKSTKETDDWGRPDPEVKDSIERAPAGTYHYNVYVPAGYDADTNKFYPCLFIASPGGNATLGSMAARVKRDGWVAIMLVESQNDDGRWLANFMAAHDDATRRLRILSDCKFATGLSGGARCASKYGAVRPGFQGLLLQAAGYGYHASGPKTGHYIMAAHRKNRDMLVYGTFGERDKNGSEIERVKAALPASTRYKVERFDGGHEWAPPACIENAFDWFEAELFTKANGNRLGKGAYVWFLDNQMRAYTAAESAPERYAVLERILPLASTPVLLGDARLAAQFRELRNAQKTLGADPAIKQNAGSKLHKLPGTRE